ncbi:hypothetical protein [Luteimonas sp. R10]|uniref:hypothetical protein n=1 Tax=Luteimonas sp. R10 TaxID=3108176 RepID=UPI003091653F|nr:hypothetical protein U3649_14475 [Luteimonas sp. R10]
MSRTTSDDAVDQILADLCRFADTAVANKRGAALMAMDPAKRADMEDMLQKLRRWVPRLKKAHAKLSAAEAALAKALRNNRPRISA